MQIYPLWIRPAACRPDNQFVDFPFTGELPHSETKVKTMKAFCTYRVAPHWDTRSLSLVFGGWVAVYENGEESKPFRSDSDALESIQAKVQQ